MARSRPPRVKICCIQSVAEAEMAVAAGAAALGLVSAMPSGPGPIDEGSIAEVARRVPPPVATFLLTSLTDVEAIADQQRRCGVDTLQLCRPLAPGGHAQLRRALPGVRLVQVVHVVDEDSVAAAEAVAPQVDAVLLDTGDPAAAVPLLGGTGRTHDWSLSRRIRERVSRPVFLAGGLRPGNVAAAVAAVGPFAVDLCSGVRTDGRLDASKLAAFIAAVDALGQHRRPATEAPAP